MVDLTQNEVRALKELVSQEVEVLTQLSSVQPPTTTNYVYDEILGNTNTQITTLKRILDKLNVF